MELSFHQRWSRDPAHRVHEKEERNLRKRDRCKRPWGCERVISKPSADGKMLPMWKLLQLAMERVLLGNYIPREKEAAIIYVAHIQSDYTCTSQITTLQSLCQLFIIPSSRGLIRQWQKPWKFGVMMSLPTCTYLEVTTKSRTTAWDFSSG